MGWLLRKSSDIAARVMKRELQQFVDQLQGLEGFTLGIVVATASQIGVAYAEKIGPDLYCPFLALKEDPGLGLMLSRHIKSLQRKNNLHAASAWMVWLHTIRAEQRLEMRPLAKEMWRHLSRGFPYVEMAADEWTVMTGQHLDTRRATEFPFGFDPETEAVLGDLAR